MSVADNDINKMKKDSDWGDFIIKKELGSDPDSRTATNSGSGVLLAILMQNLLGSQDLEQYIEEHLFTPIGIEKYNWVRDPSGNLDGATGLFLSDLDFLEIRRTVF